MSLIISKNNLTDGGFTIGYEIQKDMDTSEFTDEFTPANNLNLFPDLPIIIDANIIVGDKNSEDKNIGSYWSDWGNDVFDDWGWFYLYDVASQKYYFPLFTPLNQDDGIITTQTFNAFGRTFTIKHGFPVEGIFKFDISVNDNLPFRFGSYGNMGSDGDENTDNLTHNYSLNSTNLTLYYHFHSEDGDNTEILYSYFIPKNISQNNAQTYNVYYDGDDMSMFSNEINNGLLVYYSKKNDVKEWVVNDLQYGETEQNLLPEIELSINVLNRKINNKRDDYNIIHHISNLYEEDPDRLNIIRLLLKRSNLF